MRSHYSFVFLCLLSTNVHASMKSEIDHLLNFVKTTNCVYERNGKKHTGSEAYKHILRKYNYYEDDVETTEDFIKYSATKSKISGKYYLIHCSNEKGIKSQAWLLEELSRFRQNETK